VARRNIEFLSRRATTTFPLIIVSVIGGNFEKPPPPIFLSCIFLSAKSKQENAGEENVDLRISHSFSMPTGGCDIYPTTC
jgi:hypothetical protein